MLGFFLHIFSLLLRKKYIKTEAKETGRKTGLICSTIIVVTYLIVAFTYKHYLIDKERQALNNGKMYFRAYTMGEFLVEGVKQFVMGGDRETIRRQ